MKILSNLLLMTCMVMISQFATAQKKGIKEDSITVYGNCEQCKERIETSLDLSGVKYAAWNMDTKKLFIAYKPSKISEQEIHEAITKVGHDTDKLKTQDSTYINLPFCCLYRDGNPHHDNHKKGAHHNEDH